MNVSSKYYLLESIRSVAMAESEYIVVVIPMVTGMAFSRVFLRMVSTGTAFTGMVFTRMVFTRMVLAGRVSTRAVSSGVVSSVTTASTDAEGFIQRQSKITF